MFGPYRQAPQQDPRIQQEMQEAVALMWRWRRYSPVIAGGALWSWAAGKRARDVDIFMRAGFWSRRAMKRYYGPHKSEGMGEREAQRGYTLVNESTPVERFITHLECGTPVDLVLTPWKGGEVAQYFDYLHCAVAFGVEVRVHFGIYAYAEGVLQAQHGHIRTEAYVKSKLQPSLWGEGNTAVQAMLDTMNKLDVELAAQGG